MSDSQLSHSIMMRYGTGAGEPTSYQVQRIKFYIQRVKSGGRTPTETDLYNAVYLYCPTAGKFSYSGIDNSEVQTMLALALQVARR